VNRGVKRREEKSEEEKKMYNSSRENSALRALTIILLALFAYEKLKGWIL